MTVTSLRGMVEKEKDQRGPSGSQSDRFNNLEEKNLKEEQNSGKEFNRAS